MKNNSYALIVLDTNEWLYEHLTLPEAFKQLTETREKGIACTLVKVILDHEEEIPVLWE